MSLKQCRKAITALCAAAPRASDKNIASKVFARLTRREINELAMLQLAQMVWEHKRYGQLAVERSSEVYQVDRTVAAILDDPALLYGPKEQRASEATHPGFNAIRLGQSKYRDSFVSRAGKRFDRWIARAEKIAKRSGNMESFNFHWNQDYSSFTTGLSEAISQVIDSVKEELRLEITAELLATEFALGNGQRVTWAIATVDQHRQRIAMLRKNIEANVEATARHEAAVAILTETKKPCLGKIPVKQRNSIR